LGRWLRNHGFSSSFLTFWSRDEQKPSFFIEFFDFFDILGLGENLIPLSSGLRSSFGRPRNVKKVKKTQ
jgi:hypothetical protein